ncbi:YycH family regulatory protein [Lacticaseibacillus porcinae]|uniref:YycH family regulatory protein n=1 Tax=Lacticaseibacillus porcinae TaxID=1123687 RepID=UPI0013DE065F|nr:two-component system activity regulator YycH [Lacticaseibacillus porcinae]
MKLSGWLLRIGLILMIALSLVLSWVIWQNPSRLGHQQAAVTVTKKSDKDTTKNIGTVLAPTQAYYQHDNNKQLLFTPDDDVISDLRTTVKNWQLKTVTSGGKLTASEYNALLASNDTLQLVYPDSVAYQLFDGNWFKDDAKAANFNFNRIVINLNAHRDSMVFVNDRTRAIHTATLKSHSVQKLQAQVDAATTTSFNVQELRLSNGRQVADFTSEIQVQPYVYLLDQQSANHYVSLLMPATQTSTVDARELGSDTVYTAGTDYRLTLNQDTQVMQFDDASATTNTASLKTNLQKSYTALSNLDLLGMNSMRYYRYTKATSMVTFRSVAQGIPIFNADYYGRVTVADTDSGRQMYFSTNNLTVPIPTSQAKTTLPTTQTVIDHITNVGYNESAIEDIALGYHWVKQDENSQVVNLKPTYYVEIGGRYRRYTKWLGPDADKQASAATSAVAHEQQ